MRDFNTRVIVAGGGPAGLAAALGLARAGIAVTCLTGGVRSETPGRTVALMRPAVAFLDGLGLETGLRAAGAPLAAIRLIDATEGLFRAPETLFRAAEIDADWFGLNVSADKLVTLLRQAFAATAARLIDAPLAGLELTPSRAIAKTADGLLIEAELVIGADGRQSLVREAAGIHARSWSYDQTALAFHVAHTKDHEDISTEFHTREGPFTLVPMQGHASSVVWMTRPAAARRLMALDDQAFALAAERRCQSLLGKFTLTVPRAAIPLHGLVAQRVHGTRAALAGEAAHAFPPIGAQGLNLGLRDAQALISLARDAPDAGAATVLEAYEQSRRFDIESRTAAVDLMNRSILMDFAGIDALRAAGLHLVNTLPPLRRALMRLGLGEPLFGGR